MENCSSEFLKLLEILSSKLLRSSAQISTGSSLLLNF